jgi:methionyl aminopeptidase
VVKIKNPSQILGIKKSSRLAATTLQYLSGFIRPGITTQFLDDLAVKFIAKHKAIAAPLNYDGFPKSTCTSINNVVCHGIPSLHQKLKNGDIINIDITTILDGYYGDTSATFPVGQISSANKKLLEVTKKAMELSVKAVKPGLHLNDCVGKIIEPYVKKYNYSVVRELGGHGVGLKFHEDPFVFHFDTNRQNILLKPGMIFTIEPMINASPDWRISIDRKDGWTVRTLDGSNSAQFEHTILVTPTGSEILTKL